MRKYKQVKEKKVIYSLDEWAIVEQRAASLAMKTGTFIKRMSLDGHITYLNMPKGGRVMKALHIIGANINRIEKKANEINSIYAEDIEKLRKENNNRRCTVNDRRSNGTQPTVRVQDRKYYLHSRAALQLELQGNS